MMKGEILEAVEGTDPRDRLSLEQERQAGQAQVDSAWEACRQAERQLSKAESKLLSCDLKLAAEHFRDCEQKLKEAISWYIPLEELIGAPVIGVDCAEFLADIKSREGMGATLHGSQMHLSIDPRTRPKSVHPKRWNVKAVVFLDVLRDRTLRPQSIIHYEALFADVRPLFENNDTPMSNPATRMDIGFIGRFVSRNHCYGWGRLDPVHETMSVNRIRDRHRPNSGYVEIYDPNGKRQLLEPYQELLMSTHWNIVEAWMADKS